MEAMEPLLACLKEVLVKSLLLFLVLTGRSNQEWCNRARDEANSDDNRNKENQGDLPQEMRRALSGSAWRLRSPRRGTSLVADSG
jgi:hypothetical protein